MTTFSDTSPEIERLQVELMQQTPAWRKLYRVAHMNQTVRLLALSGLRQRHPRAGPEELNRRLADLLLGPELAGRAYGPLPKEDRDAA